MTEFTIIFMRSTGVCDVLQRERERERKAVKPGLNNFVCHVVCYDILLLCVVSVSRVAFPYLIFREGGALYIGSAANGLKNNNTGRRKKKCKCCGCTYRGLKAFKLH